MEGCIGIVPWLGNDYQDFLEILIQSNGAPNLEQRKKYSVKAFQTSSHYDAAIFNHFNQEEEVLKLSVNTSKTLRYGENPHQKGQFFGPLSDLMEQIHGKAELIIGKQRHGPVGTVDLAFDGRFTRFGNLAKSHQVKN